MDVVERKMMFVHILRHEGVLPTVLEGLIIGRTRSIRTKEALNAG